MRDKETPVGRRGRYEEKEAQSNSISTHIIPIKQGIHKGVRES